MSTENVNAQWHDLKERGVLDRWFGYQPLSDQEQREVHDLLYQTRSALTILDTQVADLKQVLEAERTKRHDLQMAYQQLLETQPDHEGQCSPVDAVRAARWQEALDAAYFALDQAAGSYGKGGGRAVDYWIGRALAHATIAEALRQ
jgi:hypothetical protein